MTGWPLWAQSRPAELLRYVQVGGLVGVLPGGAVLPGRSAAPPQVRLRQVFEAFAAAGTDYADESFASTGSDQEIRTPDEIFALPRHANCLDLSVAFAGACLDAGLHPMIVILDPAAGQQAGHAAVVVWLRGDWAGPDGSRAGAEEYPLAEVVLTEPPDWPGTGLRAHLDGPGEFVVVDIAGIAPVWRAEPTATLEAAVAAGARLLDGQRWRWRVGADVGLGYRSDRALPMPGWPEVAALEPPYHAPGTRVGPLANIRARNAVVRFEDRGELDQLQLWCTAPDTENLIRVAAVLGVGGSGKTRLAAELAKLFAQRGWHTGFLRKELFTPIGGDGSADRELALGWLGRVRSPLLLVVDYVEAGETNRLKALFRQLALRRARTVVLMTARDVGDWSGNLDRALGSSGIKVVRRPDMSLADRHPNPAAVYRRAYRRFAVLTDTPGDPPLDPPGGLRRWTTLDIVLHAWIAAHRVTELPASRAELYDEILDREFDNWNDAVEGRRWPRISRETLRRIAAGISLLNPPSATLTKTLDGFELTNWTSVRPAELAELLRLFLPDDGGTRLALRPDPLADHLITRVFGADQAFFDTLSTLAVHGDSTPLVQALTRAATDDPDTTDGLAERFLGRHPEQWPAALATAFTQSGPFVRPLETLATTPDTPLPLAWLAESIPPGHGSLRPLALIAATRTHTSVPGPTNDSERAELARLLNNLSIRQADNGDHRNALVTITEAVDIRRHLAETNPAAYLPDLAMSLNNLSNRQSDGGDRQGALVSITEAVDIRRHLAEANPAAYLPDLAMSLNNLSNRQSDGGDRQGALVSITEAVDIRRHLAEANPAAYLPDLATSLNNLSVHQSRSGDRQGALMSITEAVDIRRHLAEANPAAYLPDLAGSLNNLSNHQSGSGDRQGALVSITEAVDIRRRLAEANPAAYLPDLAGSLNNLSNRQSDGGDRQGALVSITEAVEQYRRLAKTNPATYLPNLATSLNNLSNRQSDGGDRQGALVSITEAVDIRRRLAEANPAAYLPDLAMSLNNLSNHQSGSGDRQGALVSITEAVEQYRRLAEANPATYLPDLAMSLNNLSNHQSDGGDRQGALMSITEAVEQYRHLAKTNPATYLPNLATSLNNLSVHQSGSGDRQGALVSITEAVEQYRRLAEANPATYLPDLAGSLNNLSNHQSDGGDRQGALMSITEAVEQYRRLAKTNPATYLPNLATSLNNLSVHQSGSGDRQGALMSITEAVDIRRHLAKTNPAAYLPDLAGSLNNLSNHQSGSGDRQGALVSITEAVEQYRRLAEANPATYLPDLAGSLNNLSNRQSDGGDRQGALVSITEAVEQYRHLAEANPAAYLPDLAMSLNNLSNRQSDGGDRQGALMSITEAVDIRRHLAEVNPAAYLPDLATSLNNLSNHQSRSGDRQGALVSITEAVDIRRHLAEANPAAYLPDLAQSLNNLANRQADTGDYTAAMAVWESAWEGLGRTSTAFLALGRHLWRRSVDQADNAMDDLVLAARCADHDEDDVHPRFVGEVRQQVRAAISPSDDVSAHDLPGWATIPIEDSIVELLSSWLPLNSWQEREDYFRAHRDTLGSEHSRAQLTALTRLHPELRDLGRLEQIIATAATQGWDTTLADLGAESAANDLLQDWLGTSTWTESQRFLEQHPQLCSDPRYATILAAADGDAARQHLAILRLVEHFPIGEVYDTILDEADTRDLLFTIIPEGNPVLIRELWFASPHLTHDPFAGPLTIAALGILLGDDLPSEAVTEAAQAARSRATESSRTKAIQALRALDHSLGGKSSIKQVIEILDTPLPNEG